MTTLYIATIEDTYTEQLVSTNLQFVVLELLKRTAYVDISEAEDEEELKEHMKRWSDLPNVTVSIRRIKPKVWFGEGLPGDQIFEGEFGEFVEEFFCHRCWTAPDDDYSKIRTDLKYFGAEVLKVDGLCTCATCEPLNT